MPNWCEGKLKVRGKKENIMKWLSECVAVMEPDEILSRSMKMISILEQKMGKALSPYP